MYKIIRVSRISTVKFREACAEIVSDQSFKREIYFPIVKKKIQTHFLRLPLQRIAERYLPYHKVGYKVYFPAVLVIKIASKMDVYVTDLIRLLK